MEVGCQKKQVVSKHAVQIKLSVEFQSDLSPAGVGQDRSVYGIKVGIPKW